MDPEPVVGRDPAAQSRLVADHPLRNAADRAAGIGLFFPPVPFEIFKQVVWVLERLPEFKGAVTSVHRASRIPADAPLWASPGPDRAVSPYDGRVRESVNG